MTQDVIYIGTYSAPLIMGTGEIYQGMGKGIYPLTFSPQKGTIHSGMPVVPAVNPSFIHSSANHKYLYTVNEADARTSCVSSYRIESEHGLRFLNRSMTGGASPCHICTDSKNRLLFTANYGGGSISVFRLRDDGSIQMKTDLVRHEGHGIDPVRQESPHVHHVLLDENDEILYATDLGLDMVNAYHVNYSTGKLSPIPELYLRIQPGQGPRSLALHPSGKFLYLTTEMGNTCIVYEKKDRKWNQLQEISSIPQDITCSNLTAEIHISPDGNFLYLSNRGHNSIGVFSISDTDGRLTPIQWVFTHGETPRSFCMDYSGKWLICANQDSDNLSVFSRDTNTGTLDFMYQEKADTPVCIRMYGLVVHPSAG